jgi:hypothetical protein
MSSAARKEKGPKIGHAKGPLLSSEASKRFSNIIDLTTEWAALLGIAAAREEFGGGKEGDGTRAYR